MEATECVSAKELGRLLGYTPQMLSHLANIGELERPEMVLGPDSRWRRAWTRAYVQSLRDHPRFGPRMAGAA